MPKIKQDHTVQEKSGVSAVLLKDEVLTENSDAAKDFHVSSCFGTLAKSGRVELSLFEAMLLMERGKLRIVNAQGRIMSEDQFIRAASRRITDFMVGYRVFRDIRDRGYIIKTALKFGANFRVYARGVKPGDDHAKWIIYPVHQNRSFTWQEFSAKNRVAHSTKKHLLIGVVDDEGDVSYWECRWIRP